VLDLVTRRLPKYLQGDPLEDIQVLVPMRRGPLGVEALNMHLQLALNPPSGEKRELTHGERVFREGDKVMQVRNHYQKDVYNGDVGRVVEIDAEDDELIVEFDGRPVTYAAGEFDNLTLAYAVSVHKSQGSEYPCVVLPVVFQHRVMLQRNLLYTGVTRAKRLVMLVGSKGALQVAVKNAEGQHRYSWLSQRLQASV
jgi:exodeoxyribonuclease V alpha subunit